MQVTREMYQTGTVQKRTPSDSLREASGNEFTTGQPGSGKRVSPTIAGLPEPPTTVAGG